MGCHSRQLLPRASIAWRVSDHPYRKVKIVSTQSLVPLPLKCYELLAFLADAKEPVQQEDMPKPLAGDPLTVCRGKGYVESCNANIEKRFPGANLRTQEKGGRRYYDYETRRWLGTIFLNHIRLSKEGQACLAEYRLRCVSQSAKPEQGQGEKSAGLRRRRKPNNAPTSPSR